MSSQPARSSPAGAPLAVTASLDDAGRRAAGGEHVVLVVDPAESAAVAQALSGGAGPGRVHLLVGDAADPSVRLAAGEMAAELGARRGE